VRASALLIIGALAITAASAARLAAVHKHGPRGVAVVAVNASDTQWGAPRVDLGAVTSPPVRSPGAQFGRTGPAHTSDPASSRTAGTVLVRGPPGEAAA
jgi:hypothetical protein